MVATEQIAGQVELLLRQRLQLSGDRYTAVVQLRQHDYRLLDALQLLQYTLQSDATAESRLAPWLAWLATASVANLFAAEQLPPLAKPQQVWLLLHELKFRQQPQRLSALLLQSLAAKQADSALAWQFAARQPLPCIKVLQTQLQAGDAGVDALFYLGLSGQRQLLPLLLNYIRELDTTTAQYAVAQWAAYLLGQHVDEVALVIALQQSGQLTAVALMLLTIAADSRQAQLINYLAAAHITQAIAAMAYSGQLKFVPLLLELAQQADTAQAAADALTTMLGVLDADDVMATRQVAAVANSKGRRTLAGFGIDPEQLAIVWRQGNQQQRQLAACYQFYQTPGTALQFSDALTAGAML